jgi:Ca2+-binding RTX toxin-like protein
VRRLLLVTATALTASVVWVPVSSAGTVVANVEGGSLTVTGTAGDDGITVRCEGGNVTVNQSDPGGGPAPCPDLDRILVFAGEGDDHVGLGDVTRSAFGGLEDVSVDGQEGNDTLVGSGLGDSLEGGGGVDSLRGGDGKDVLEPGPGPGEVLGGQGKDTVSVFGDGNWFLSDSLLRFTSQGEDNTLRSVERAKIRGGNANNLITAGTFGGALTVDAGGGDDLVGSGTGNDKLDGGDGNDFLQSGDGNDMLWGRAGDDVLRGDNGNDQIDGGPGNDTCTGAGGADAVVSC